MSKYFIIGGKTELSKEDSGFLARQAAEADRIRNGLIACQAYADSLQADQEPH